MMKRVSLMVMIDNSISRRMQSRKLQDYIFFHLLNSPSCAVERLMLPAL